MDQADGCDAASPPSHRTATLALDAAFGLLALVGARLVSELTIPLRIGGLHWAPWVVAAAAVAAYTALRRAANKPVLQALARGILLASSLAGAIGWRCSPWYTGLALLAMVLAGERRSCMMPAAA